MVVVYLHNRYSDPASRLSVSVVWRRLTRTGYAADREVAVKILRAQFNNDKKPARNLKFRREAQSAARLIHPFNCQYF